MPSTAYCAVSMLVWMLVLGGIIYTLYRAAISLYNKIVGEKKFSIGFGDIGKSISKALSKAKGFGQSDNLAPKNLKSTKAEVCAPAPNNLKSGKGATTKVAKTGNKSGEKTGAGRGRPKKITEAKEKEGTGLKVGKKPKGKTGNADAKPGSKSNNAGRDECSEMVMGLKAETEGGKSGSDNGMTKAPKGKKPDTVKIGRGRPKKATEAKEKKGTVTGLKVGKKSKGKTGTADAGAGSKTDGDARVECAGLVKCLEKCIGDDKK